MGLTIHLRMKSTHLWYPGVFNNFPLSSPNHLPLHGSTINVITAQGKTNIKIYTRTLWKKNISTEAMEGVLQPFICNLLWIA